MTDHNEEQHDSKFDFDFSEFTDPKPAADNTHRLESDGVFCFRDECPCHSTGDRDDELITTEESFTVRDLQGKLAEHQTKFPIE